MYAFTYRIISDYDEQQIPQYYEDFNYLYSTVKQAYNQVPGMGDFTSL